jgi:hypothetical protein
LIDPKPSGSDLRFNWLKPHNSYQVPSNTVNSGSVLAIVKPESMLLARSLGKSIHMGTTNTARYWLEVTTLQQGMYEVYYIVFTVEYLLPSRKTYVTVI